MTMSYHFTIGQHLSSLQVRQIEQVIEETFQEIYDHCNPWNPASEISQLNQSGAGLFLLSPLLAKLLALVERCFQETEGLFDPSIGAIWNYWRYSLEQEKMPSSEELKRIGQAQGWDQFELNRQALKKKHPETQLDVCGIVKGFCVDLLVERIRSLGIKHALVEWGGEIYALGSHPENRAWCIAIRDQMPNGDMLDLGTVALHEHAIASSGIAQRLWSIEVKNSKKNYYHFIHPKTFQPLSQENCHLLICSIEAESCALADAYATTCMLFSSPEELQKFFDQKKTISRLWALFRNGKHLILEKSTKQTNSNFQKIDTLKS